MSRFVLHKIAGVTVKYKAECNVKEKREGYLMVMMMNIIIDDQVFFSSSIIQFDHAFAFILLLQTQDRMLWVFRAGVLQGSAENIFNVGRRYGRIDKIRNFKNVRGNFKNRQRQF